MEVPGLAQVAEHRTGSKGGNWVHPDHTEAFLKGRWWSSPEELSGQVGRNGSQGQNLNSRGAVSQTYHKLHPGQQTGAILIPWAGAFQAAQVQTRVPEPFSCHLPFENKLAC